MDVLSDIIRRIKLSSVVYFNKDFHHPWGMDIPKGNYAQFHLISKGQCLLDYQNQKIKLFAGDIILFPFGAPHWLADVDKSTRSPGSQVVSRVMKGMDVFEGDELATTILCGHFEFDNHFDHPSIHHLPEMIIITDDEKREHQWLNQIASLVIQETSKHKNGSKEIIEKLAEILFIYVLRAYMVREKIRSGFYAAINDEKLSKVLSAIHNNVHYKWDLNSLAKEAGMSRTSFFNRFKSLMGESPIQYLTNWRLDKAKELLMESGKTIGQISEEVGYHSEAAFNRLFKKKNAITPLKYRRQVLSSATEI